MSAVYEFIAGESPLLVSMPHNGIEIPPVIADTMHDYARLSPDTDWRLDELYDFAPELGASVLVARASRYVVDLNRNPAGEPLYAGADNTELCPTTTFDRLPVYMSAVPDKNEQSARVDAFWQPYHQRLARELDALRRRFGYAVLLDAHSIAPEVPRFFDGRLPDFNLGTNSGRSCAPSVTRSAERALDRFEAFSRVTDARFKGGYITRHYGQPDKGIHAIQLELSQRTYLADDGLGALDPDRASEVRPALRALVSALIAVDIARPEADA